MSIPLRNFGKTGVQISALGLGGHHLGGAKDEKTAIDIVHRALDGGITFYDNSWEYYRGKTESWLGLGLKGRRDKVFLITKVCTHGRDASLATQMLEQSQRRLQTDHLDLWQIHGVVFQNDPELFIRPDGAAEALLKAKKQGKVRFVGFTGHKDPDVHLAMLNTGFPFDSVQMPLNPFDATYFMSFEPESPAGSQPARHCAIGNEAYQRTWGSRANGRAHCHRSVALRHEPSRGLHHLRGRRAANYRAESGNRTKLCADDRRRNAGTARPLPPICQRRTFRVV